MQNQYHGVILFVKGKYNVSVRLDNADTIKDMVNTAYNAIPDIIAMGADAFAIVYHDNDVPYMTSSFDVVNGIYVMR